MPQTSPVPAGHSRPSIIGGLCLQALVGIHGPGFRLGDAEEGRVELLPWRHAGGYQWSDVRTWDCWFEGSYKYVTCLSLMSFQWKLA